MAKVVTKDMIPAYEAFVQSHPKGHFSQSILWAKQKPMWKWEAVVSTDAEGNIKGSLAMLIRKVPGTPYTLMYACRGPVCDLSDKETLTDLVNGAKEIAKRYKSYEIKIDPDVPSSNTEFTKMMTDLGFVITGGGKNFEAIQPKYVFRLDIEGKTEEEIMAGFHQKTRYNLRLAVKKGVEVKLCGKEAVEDFTRIMEVTGARDGFVTRQASYFANMLDNLGEHCRLYMAYHEGQPIAGTMAIWYGDKVWYLYGASSNEHRNLMPNYLLQWNMIQSLTIGDYSFSNIKGITFSKLPYLESITIGNHCFTTQHLPPNLGSDVPYCFKIADCEHLVSFKMGTFCCTNWSHGIELENLPNLETIEIGDLVTQSWNFAHSSFIIHGL